ncbi:unnamed protein product, partial [Mesorhabditis spiculigera]
MNQEADTFLYPLLQMGPFSIHQEYDFLKRLLRRRLKRPFLPISGRNSKRQIDLREYKRPGWTFHAKGLWMRDEGVAATLIGSSNYGYRSVHRDLEAQVLLVTKNEKLKSSRSVSSISLTKLSSAGLIYAHYGRAIIAEVLKIEQDDPRVNIFYRRLYETFVEQIDAVDNGIQHGPLPKKWRGLRDEELSSVVGVEGCVFAHMTGFIGGHKTREGAIEMARRALPIVDKEMEEEVAEKKAKLGSGDDA